MELYEALYTTRAMRRLKPDPIPLEIQAKIVDAAIRAPSGGNGQRWRFLLVDDPALRTSLGPIYRDCVQMLWTSPAYGARIEVAKSAPDLPEHRGLLSMLKSAQHLADHFEEVPLLFFAFAQNDRTGSSIYPSVWSAMLAARAEGIGTCLTTILDFRKEDVLALLGVPAEDNWTMTACVTMGYPTGKWGVAERTAADQVAYRNTWGGDFGMAIPAPLWPGDHK